MEITKPQSKLFSKCLFFGPAGGGKTTLLGTAEDDPRTSPMLLLDYEGGLTSLVGRDIDVVRIRSWQDYNEVYTLLASDGHQYKSVGLDSISETHIFSLLKLLDEPGRKGDPNLLAQGDYGKALVQMRRLIREFRDLPLHLFATALAKDDVDPRIGAIRKPSLVGSFADEAPGLFDLVGYLNIGDVTNEAGEVSTERILILQNYPSIRAKVRSPWGTFAPDEIVSPTITSVLDALNFKEASK